MHIVLYSNILLVLAGTTFCEHYYYYGTLCYCKKNENVVLINGTTCSDLDECQVNNGGCEHHCSNSPGSYSCSCDNGYKLQNDNHGCEDVDECADRSINDGCADGCINTVGGYYCSCPSNRELAPNAVTIYQTEIPATSCQDYPVHIDKQLCQNANTNFGLQTCTCVSSITGQQTPVADTGACLGLCLLLKIGK